MNNIPTSDEEAFKFLIEKAHAREGAYLSPSTRNMLEHIAREVGVSWDEKGSDDGETHHSAYPDVDISDEELAIYL